MRRLIPSENPRLESWKFEFVVFESFFVESVITMFGCNVKKNKQKDIFQTFFIMQTTVV